MNVSVQAQNTSVQPEKIIYGKFLGETKAIRDLPDLTEEDWIAMKTLAEKKVKKSRDKDEARLYKNLANASVGPDPLWNPNTKATQSSSNLLKNFSGQNSPYYPSDATGTVGPGYFFQTINCVYGIYDQNGTLLKNGNLNTLFNGVAGSAYNDGDPVILWDEQANRWVIIEFSITGNNDFVMFAVSTSTDPQGTYYAYSFDVDDTPDYEKVGVWRDGYYMGTNTSGSKDVYVVDRAAMIAGNATAAMIGFVNPNRPNSGFHCIMPLDNDGTFSPSGSPGLFITINDDAWTSGSKDQLWIYELNTNWTTPASSTFSRVQQIDVAAFDSYFGASWNDISQLGTTQKLDAVPQVIMNIPQYRNFGTYQSIVACHTVDYDGNARAGIRWYELRKNNGDSNWSIRQQGTYAPDATSSRWMGSIRLNGNNQIGLGYSIAGDMYPGVRYTGQSNAAYLTANGTMDVTEGTIQNGVTFQSSYNRWGDYAGISIDPNDDKTFWFTTQYTGTGGSRSTKIASFTVGTTPVVVTQAASSITATTATLNGKINPQGASTTYYFQWGTSVSYGNTTSSFSAGSGLSDVMVNQGITGLIAGTAYHFRVVAVNSDGTFYGNDLSFQYGVDLPTVTTNAVTSIGPTYATCGGNVTNDGGGTVTERGVCWSTSSSPTIANSKTVDGSGTGSFTSSITGLTVNTLYYVRAYATNVTGTAYGDEYSFTPTCSTYNIPFTEGFSGTSIPACWSTASSGSPSHSWSVTSSGTNGITGTTAPYGYISYTVLSTGIAYLVSPDISAAGFSNVTLGFKYYYILRNKNISVGVEYSVDGGSTWSNQITWPGNGGGTSSANPATYSAAIPALDNQANIKIRWFMNSNANTYTSYFSIDDISLTGTALPPPVAYAMTGGGSYCSGGTGVLVGLANSQSGVTYQLYRDGTAVGGTVAGTGSAISFGLQTIAGTYTAKGTNSGGTTDMTGTAVVTVTPTVTPAVTIAITSGTNPMCAGTSVTLTATPTNGGTTPAYQWKVNGTNVGSNATTYSFTPVNNDIVTCVMTSNAVCASPTTATSNSLTMTVNPNLPVSVLIAASSNPACAGTSVTFTATPTNGGTTPAYQWKVNGSDVGTNSNTYSYAPVNGDLITCVLTSNATCATGSPATSNTVTMTVNPLLPVSVVIAESANNICSGTSVTFTATPTNGGTTPAYQWKVNGTNAGTNSNTYSYAPVNGDLVTCVLTSNATCATGSPATSNTVTMTVNPLPVITLNGPAEVCSGHSYTYFTESGMNNYNWNVSSGGSIIAGTATNSIIVLWSTSGTKTISVNYDNSFGCSAVSPTLLNIAVGQSPLPSINGPDEVCATTEDVVYTTEAGYSGYTWSVSNGGVISGGNNSNTVTVNWTAAGNKFIAVDYYDAEGCNAVSPTIKYITVDNLPAPMIFGEDTLCSGTHNVQYTTQANYFNYQWDVSAGGTIISGSGTKTILVNWDGSGAQTVSVNYETVYGCEAEEPFVLDVVVTPKLATAGTISGPALVCVPQSGVVYTVPVIADADEYFWTLPAGVTIVSGSGTNSITVDFAANAASGAIKVFASNECGNGGSSPALNVTVAGIPPTPTITYHGDTLTSSAPAGNQWYKDGEAIAGATGQNYVTTEIGTYTVIVTINGCSSDESEPFIITSVTNNMNELNTLLIQPNPNTGKFRLTADISGRQIFTLEIITNTGATIYKEEGLVVGPKFEKEMDISLSSGIYMLILRNTENRVIRKMIVTH